MPRAGRKCRCGNPIDRGPRTTKCSNCAVPRHKEPLPKRKCLECANPYRGRTRKYCTAFCRNTANERAKQERAGTVSIKEKLCKKCGVIRPSYMFNFDKTKIDYLHSVCRICNAEKHKEWRELPENKDAIRSGNLKRNYGITLQEYNSLLAFQNNVCAICRKPPSKRRLAVDHDHTTGAIRGLACFLCNKFVIGNSTLADAKALVTYLEMPPANLFFGTTRIVPENKKVPKRKRRKTRKN